MRRWLLRFAALMMGCLLALGLLELLLFATDALPLQRNPLRGFHQSDSRLGWAGVPSYAARFRQQHFDVVIEHGSDGFRAPAHGVADFVPDARRVAFLGDSFTWGWGVASGEVFTDGLQRLVAPDVRIRNFGVNAYGTGQQQLLLEKTVLAWNPDVVVVMFFANDLDENRDGKGGRRPWYELVDGALQVRNLPVEREISGRGRSLARSSRSLSFLRFNLNRLGEQWKRLRREREWAPPALSPEEDEERWALYDALLGQMKGRCDEAGVELAVVYIPRPMDLGGVGESALASHLVRSGEQTGVRVFDLTPGLRAAWKAHPESAAEGAPIHFPNGGHWSAVGHAAAAELLAGASLF